MSLVAAYDRRALADARYHHAPLRRVFCDNTAKDGPGIRANSLINRGLPLLKFSGGIALVRTEAECDEACGVIRQRAATFAQKHALKTPLVGFDTESVAYIPPFHLEGTSSNKAAASARAACARGTHTMKRA